MAKYYGLQLLPLIVQSERQAELNKTDTGVSAKEMTMKNLNGSGISIINVVVSIEPYQLARPQV